MRLLSEKDFLTFLNSWIHDGKEQDFVAKEALFSICCFKEKSTKDDRLSDQFVNRFCRLLLDVAEQPEKLTRMLSMIETEWGAISVTQRSSALSCITKLAKNISDVTSLVLIGEILGEYYSNKEAFLVLRELVHETHGEKKAVLCDGMKKFAICSKEVREAAVRTLRRLSKDPEKIVSQEAVAALSHLRKRDRSHKSQ